LRFMLTLTAVIVTALTVGQAAQAHLVTKPKRNTLKVIEKSQRTNLNHSRYVCKHGKRFHKRWSCKAVKWLSRELQQTRRAMRPVRGTNYWIGRQIWAANQIGASSGGDPWPNCPDPFDGGGSWQATVNCENSGNWYDSAGYYRCGLQFDPMWERKYGRLCP
jgi:hypothetical protein